MSIVDRIKNICLTPSTEWPVIANEASSTGSLIAGYVAPLAAVSALAGFIGVSIIGQSGFFTGTYRLPFAAGLALAVWTFVGAIIGVVIVGFLINALAPTLARNEKRRARDAGGRVFVHAGVGRGRYWVSFPPSACWGDSGHLLRHLPVVSPACRR